MSTRKKQVEGVRINSKHSTYIGGDVVGRDKINKTTYSHLSGFVVDLSSWQRMMIDEVKKANLSIEEKKDLEKQIELIRLTIEKDKGKNPSRLEKLINILAVMSEDIFEVAIATLVNPLAGIGLVLKKVGDKAKLEMQTK